MQNVEQTIISQYGTAPTLNQLITNMNGYLDPSADLDSLYSTLFDIDSAVGVGLDNWGTIVGVDRSLQLPNVTGFFGFKQGDNTPFGTEPFHTGESTLTYLLEDDAFRTLILVKALANISNCTPQSYNQLLKNMFSTRGRCYALDLGNMKMQYVFEFYLYPYELAIIEQSGIFPRPAGVQIKMLQMNMASTFGFSEAGPGRYQPLGYGAFAKTYITVS